MRLDTEEIEALASAIALVPEAGVQGKIHEACKEIAEVWNKRDFTVAEALVCIGSMVNMTAHQEETPVAFSSILVALLRVHAGPGAFQVLNLSQEETLAVLQETEARKPPETQH